MDRKSKPADNFDVTEGNDEKAEVREYELLEDGTYKIVFSDGVEEVFSDEEFYMFGLYMTEVPLDKTYDEIMAKTMERRAYMRAVSILRGSLKPERFVKRQLSGEGFGEDAISGAMERLREEGAADDYKYCRKYVRKKADQGNASRMLMSMELRENGIDDRIISEVLDEEDVDDKKTAYKLAQKKRKNGDPDDKIKRYLSAKGFSSDVIIAVVGGREDID